MIRNLRAVFSRKSSLGRLSLKQEGPRRSPCSGFADSATCRTLRGKVQAHGGMAGAHWPCPRGPPRMAGTMAGQTVVAWPSRGTSPNLIILKILPWVLFVFGCSGLCCTHRLLPYRGAQASHCGGFSCRGAGALGAQAQGLWCTSLVAPRRLVTSQTRD